MNEKEKYIEDFNNGLHRLGRTLMVTTIVLLIAVPFVFGAFYDVMPDAKGFLAGYIKVAMIYLPVSFVEFLVYAPMLGVGGSYIAFITGNVTNMKIPCAMNAQDIAGVKKGSSAADAVSGIAVAVASLTTMIIIATGVLLMTPLQPVLESEFVSVAANYVVPALFG